MCIWSVLFAVLALRSIYIPPGMTFRKIMCNELYSEAPIRTLPLVSYTGYVNTDFFVQWLRHFQNYVKATEIEPALLVWIITFPISA
jgi:hypothetical protein